MLRDAQPEGEDMISRNTARIAALALAVGLFGVLATSAAAKSTAKVKTKFVSEAFLLQNGTTGTTDQADGAAVCPSGTTVLGGGALANTPTPAPAPIIDTELFKTGPIDNAWYVRFDSDADVNLLPSAQAICLKDKLKTTGLGGAKALTSVKQANTAFTLPGDALPTNGQAQIDVCLLYTSDAADE